MLICDVINRIEGRTEVIKGVERAPKNRTQALTNVNKTLEFLRTHPKMNSRYLWSAKNVLDGDEYVVWGLLEDIKTFYTVAPKTNNHSVSRRENSINRSRFSPNNSYLANNLPFSAQQSAIMSVAQNSPHNQSAVVARHHIQEPNATKEMVIPKSFLQEKSKNLRSYAASARSRTPISRTPTSQTPLLMSPRVNRPPSSLTKKPSKSQTFISEDTKNQIKL